MAELSGLQVFKYLPAAKKLPEGNCKKCGCPTCMAFALKLAKGQVDIGLCAHAPEDLKSILEQSLKKPQKEVFFGRGTNKVLIGGENVLFRHDKTFINKTAICVVLNSSQKDWTVKLNQILNFEITRISEVFKVDLVCLDGDLPEEAKQKLDERGIAWVLREDFIALKQISETKGFDTIKALTAIRKKAVLEKDEKFSDPTYVYFKHESDLNNLMVRASFYLCKYANMLVFEDFDAALISTLMTLRQNIFTDPQKPLQVESKIYEFNNPDKDAIVFLTTNFALTYFAVANEIEALGRPAYLIITPSDGMSVLTAWSAEKFTAQVAAKTVEKFELAQKINHRRIIIPGLLAHMKDEMQEAMQDFEIIVGTVEACQISDFVRDLEKKNIA